MRFSKLANLVNAPAIHNQKKRCQPSQPSPGHASPPQSAQPAQLSPAQPASPGSKPAIKQASQANISWIESPLGRLHCNGHRCMVLWGSLSYAVHVFLRILYGKITFHSVQVCVCAFIEAFMLLRDGLGCVRVSVCAICFNFCCFWASGAKHGETKNPYGPKWFCLPRRLPTITNNPFLSSVSICVEFPFGRIVTALVRIERVMDVVHMQNHNKC